MSNPIIECIRDTTGRLERVPESKISLSRGDTRTLTFRTRDIFGARVTITGATITFTVRPSIGGAQTFQRATGGTGITISTQSGNTLGEFSMTITAANTSSQDPGKYMWDCQMVLSSETNTISRGNFVIEGDIT